MTIVIADKLPEESLNLFREFADKVIFEPERSPEELDNGLEKASILVVRSTTVSRKCIENSPKLTLIIRAGAGVNNIDMKAASERGIYVANCPGKNAIAVAELTMGLIISLDRFIPDAVREAREGKWNKGAYSKADGLYGQTLGIVGLGPIGQEVASRAKAFGMDVVAWSRSLTKEQAGALGIRPATTPEEVAAEADVLTLHVALAPETEGLVSTLFLKKMKPGALLVNTSRAEVVDEEALAESCRDGRVRAALDVLQDEPSGKEGELSSPLKDVPGIYITHHIGASTRQAQMAVAAEAARVAREFVREGRVENWINRCDESDSPWKLVVRHYDRPGVIANVMTELKQDGINAQEVHNVIFEGKKTACCTIQLASEPSGQILYRIRGRKDEVISADLIESDD
ncbi:MAG: NAD(P)-dependent oxidoreductase [Bacteroidota bacterium]